MIIFRQSHYEVPLTVTIKFLNNYSDALGLFRVEFEVRGGEGGEGGTQTEGLINTCNVNITVDLWHNF